MGTGDIMAVECKVFECGWVVEVVVCVLWKISKIWCPEFVSGELVPEFNYFEKF